MERLSLHNTGKGKEGPGLAGPWQPGPAGGGDLECQGLRVITSKLDFHQALLRVAQGSETPTNQLQAQQNRMARATPSSEPGWRRVHKPGVGVVCVFITFHTTLRSRRALARHEHPGRVAARKKAKRPAPSPECGATACLRGGSWLQNNLLPVKEKENLAGLR